MRASQTLLCFISLIQLYIFKKYDPTLEDSERKKKKKKKNTRVRTLGR